MDTRSLVGSVENLSQMNEHRHRVVSAIVSDVISGVDKNLPPAGSDCVLQRTAAAPLPPQASKRGADRKKYKKILKMLQPPRSSLFWC